MPAGPVAAQRPSGRSFLIDALKAGACLLIVLHHLAFYGPMSDVVRLAWPRTIDALADHGRLAVQVFLVCSGFLMAQSWPRWVTATPSLRTWAQAMWSRYLRLAVPLLVALAFTVAISEVVRTVMEHPSLSATPEWGQALAHALLLQHLLEMEALSAGIWYVAIDWQLHALALAGAAALSWHLRRRGVHDPARVRRASLWLWLLVTLCALLVWNLQADLDDWGLYFLGAFGLGWLAHHARESRWPMRGLVVLVLLGVLALWVEPRARVATAWGTALLLAWAPAAWFAPARQRALQVLVHGLAQRSYGIFLIHFGVSLAVNAGVWTHWPESLRANALGMAMSMLLSVLAGAGLYHWTERQRPGAPQWLGALALLVASVAAARWWAL